ncbi:hypothetical protein Tco_1524309 [Tanacetum coccineum]
MGDENPIHTLRDYSKPSYEGYRNTIKLPVRNNVVPLRSDTFRLVQNGCSFHRLRSEDPYQHLKDFLKLVDSLDLDRSITTWEDLTTHFLAQFFPSGRTAKLRSDILMDFVKSVKAITLPQDVLSTSDCRLIKLENEYCIEDPEKAFVEYASSRTDEAREGLVSNFMASQDARLSKFEADLKQKHNEMTNKIDTVLKAITNRIAGTPPSNTVKNPKLSISLVLSAHSYPTIDPQCSSHPSTSINAIKSHSKEANISQTNLLQTGMGIKPQQPEEPKPTLKDEF